MKTTHRVALEGKPQPKDINAVVQGLMEFNKLHTNGAEPEYLLATVRDDQVALLELVPPYFVELKHESKDVKADNG